MSVEKQPSDSEQDLDDEWVEDAANDVADESEDLGGWGGEDLEAAYLKALSALEASDLELPATPAKASPSDDDHAAVKGGQTAEVEIVPLATEPAPAVSHDQESLIAELFEQVNPPPPNDRSVVNVTLAETRVTPRQIIEACLFVGGAALTSKRLSSVLRDEFDSDYVDREIDALNRQYAAENRPYEIRLGEGGFRMALRDEYERIRHKAYGLGPKEVRLSQDALEVLAVVAYHQPIKQSQVEELGKPGCGTVLRQLVRRELLSVERDPENPRDVNYKTTPRFLSLFGIRSLDELPRHEQVSYK